MNLRSRPCPFTTDVLSTQEIATFVFGGSLKSVRIGSNTLLFKLHHRLGLLRYPIQSAVQVTPYDFATCSREEGS